MTDATSPGDLGSLAQSARTSQLKSARGILLFIGVITLAFHAFIASTASSIADSAIDDELKKLGPGMVADPDKVAEARESITRAVQLTSGIFAGLGAVYIILGLLVYKFPVPATIASLVLYIGSHAVSAYLEPTELGRGWLIKLFIVAALFKAVQAAIAYEKERKAPSVA